MAVLKRDFLPAGASNWTSCTSAVGGGAGPGFEAETDLLGWRRRICGFWGRADRSAGRRSGIPA
ncbi:MAG: hypothetical protein ACLSHC_00290 [Bilophila wadsworthia]